MSSIRTLREAFRLKVVAIAEYAAASPDEVDGVFEALDAVVAAEREQCALICDAVRADIERRSPGPVAGVADGIARRIRERR